MTRYILKLTAPALLLLAFGLLALQPANAQTLLTLPSGTSYVQDFDQTPGASGTQWPQGWGGYNSAGNFVGTLTVDPNANSNATGFYNYNQRVGFLAASAGASPMTIVLALDNTIGYTDLEISYKLNRLKGSQLVNASVVLEYSTTSPTTGFTLVANTNYSTIQQPNRVFSNVVLPADIANQATPVYLRWRLNTTIIPFVQVPAIALDSVSLNWVSLRPSVNLGPDIAQCNAGTFVLDATYPGATYLWSDGSTDSTLTVSQSGIYSVTVTNTFGSATDDIEVLIGDTPRGVVFTQGAIFQGTFNAGTQAEPDMACAFDNIWYSLPNPAGYPNSAYGQTWEYQNFTITDIQSGANFAGAQQIIPPLIQNGQLRLRPGRADRDRVFEFKMAVVDLRTGCSDTIRRFLRIKTGPTTGLPASVVICNGNPVSLVAAPGLLNIKWSDGSTGNTFGISTPGTYWLQATGNDGCTIKDTVIAIAQSPVVELGPSRTFCGGTVLDAGLPGSQYLWSTGQTTQTIVASQSGNYRVVVTTTSGCVVEDDITVFALSKGISLLPDSIAVCVNDVVIVSTQDTTSGATYEWRVNGQALAETSPAIRANQNGFYTVRITTADCETLDTMHVTVNPQPVFSLGPDIKVCGPITLTAPIGGDVTYRWSTGQTTRSAFFTFGSQFTLTIENANGCSYTDTINIDMLPLLAFQISAPDTVRTGAVVTMEAITTQPILNWFWDFGNGFSSNLGQTIQTVYTRPGIYTISLRVEDNTCGSSTRTKQIVVLGQPLGVDDINGSQLSVYPNPVSDILNVSLSNAVVGNTQLSVVDLAGRELWSTVVQTAGETLQTQVPVEHLPSGIYLLRVADAIGQMQTVRFVRQ